MSRKSPNSTIQYTEPVDQYPKYPIFYHIDGKSANSIVPVESSTRVTLDDASESIVLPTTPPHFYGQPPERPIITIQPEEKPKSKYSYLPPISNRHHGTQPIPNHIHPMHKRYRSLHHYKQYREKYDPRWWYMPINSVHVPQCQRCLDSHRYHQQYRPPKWYELPRIEKHFY